MPNASPASRGAFAIPQRSSAAAARLAHTQEIAGSNPASATTAL